MANKKMLFLLNPDNKWHRIIRRTITVGIFAAVAVFLKTLITDIGLYIPLGYQWVVAPLLTALLAAIDKGSREI